jgi:hypothetical protein
VIVPYQGRAENRAKFLLRICFLLGIQAESCRSCRPVTIVLDLVVYGILQEAVPERDIRFVMAQSYSSGGVFMASQESYHLKSQHLTSDLGKEKQRCVVGFVQESMGRISDPRKAPGSISEA